jgi:hypothetical protein
LLLLSQQVIAMAFANDGASEQNPRIWLSIEASTDQDSGSTVRTEPAPLATIGTAIEPRHRVIEVCLGAEHGVLRTDAGIAFTWGDNRYGQLGRSPVLKEENNVPYPVLDLVNDEVVQVAAGKNHCLALTSNGHVKAWGRNKLGQLGIGSKRDKTEPKWVCLATREGEDDDKADRLGAITPEMMIRFAKKHSLDERILQGLGEDIQRALYDRSAQGENITSATVQTARSSSPKDGVIRPDPRRITSISAGGNSSIAAAANSDVWQWGEISSDFKMDDGKDKKHKQKEGSGEPVNTTRPYLVACFKRSSFRTQMRKEKDKVSIRETLCLVLDEEMARKDNKSKLVDLASDYLQWGERIAQERRSAKEIEEERRRPRGPQDKGGAAEQDAELGNLQDTLAFLERDIAQKDREIDLFTKNIESCDQQRSHNTKQKEILDTQATKLTESQGEFSQKMLDKTSGKDRKTLEQQLAEIQDFIKANENTRATLLDQRAETDKETQRLRNEKERHERDKETLEKRHQILKDLSAQTSSNSTASDEWVDFLSKQKKDLSTHFEGKPLGVGADILDAKKKLEKDEAFLRDVEAKMNEMSRLQVGTSDRSKECKALLADLVDLRRKLNDMTADKYFKEDLNYESFFKSKDKDQAGSLALLK